MPQVYRRTLAAAVVVLTGLGCDTVTEDLPHQPSSNPTPVPIVVVIVPVPTPTPAATPAPNPAPTATPPPAATGCALPKGTGSGENCPRQSPSFLAQVESAMDQLVKEEPGIFDLKRTRGCENCYQVVNWDRYVNRMAQLMDQRGLCGHYDGEELAVKDRNSFNDQYDILTSEGFIRRQLGSYRSTCYPAWF